MKSYFIVLNIFMFLVMMPFASGQVKSKQQVPSPIYIVLTEYVVDKPAKEPVSTRILITDKSQVGFGDREIFRALENTQKKWGGVAYDGNVPEKDYKELYQKINKLIWSLPQESPRLSQDIYGLKTSVYFQIGGKYWVNGVPRKVCLCCGQKKTKKVVTKLLPNKKQLETFKKIVTLIKAAGKKHVTQTKSYSTLSYNYHNYKKAWYRLYLFEDKVSKPYSE